MHRHAPCSPDQARLCDLEDQAKSAKKGMWSEGGGSHTIRELKYSIENPRNFVDSMHQKPVNGRTACSSVTLLSRTTFNKHTLHLCGASCNITATGPHMKM